MAPRLTSTERAILAEAVTTGTTVARTYHCRDQDPDGWAKQAACEDLVARLLPCLYGIKGSQYSPIDDVLWTYRITESGRRAAISPPADAPS